MRPGDVVFVEPDSLIGKIISLFDGRFAHVAIAVSENEILESNYFSDTLITPMRYKKYEIVPLTLTEEQRQLVPFVAQSLVGRRYDYFQIFWLFLKQILGLRGLKNIFNSPKRLICSETVVVVLNSIGYLPDYKELSDITPNELYKYLKEREG